MLLVAVVLVPPVAADARRYDWAEALQFVVLALVAPGLFVSGVPWQWIGLGRSAQTLAGARRRHPERLRAFAVVGLALAVAVAWRTPAAVDRIHGGGWPVYLEAASLFVPSVGLWLECIPSDPLVPRSSRPVRIALAALSMWTFWIVAYLIAMSRSDFYPAYRHAAGRGLSLIADQQVAAGVMWAVAGFCFVPLVFQNLLQWLRSEEDPDEELQRLVREERRRGTPSAPAAP